MNHNPQIPGAPTPATAAVSPGPSAIAVSPDFCVSVMGTTRGIVAGLERVNLEVRVQIEACHTTLGATDLEGVSQVDAFIAEGRLPEVPLDPSLFARISELNALDREQSRDSRVQTLLEAGKGWLESARGPGLNLLNIAGRTGLVVALATVVRQAVSYYVEQALREGDSTSAGRAWVAVALTLVDLGLLIGGAVRNEVNGTANAASRLARVSMSAIMLGSLIAGHLTGASQRVLPAMIGGSIYTLARSVPTLFLSLQSNAGAPNAANTGATTVGNGVAQFLLAELGQVLPLSGAARAAQGLGYSVGADLVGGMLNGAGMVLDDMISIFCRSCQLLSPDPGRDSVFSDPQALQHEVLQVRAGLQRPTRSDLADTALGFGTFSLSAGHSITLVLGAVASLLDSAEVGEGYQPHIVAGCVALMVMIFYFPFVFGCAKRTDNVYVLPRETMVP
ncbi:hypothetical protein QIW53_12745 [Pseudomonas fluorescens]|uniref:hypothetical protein n=1 Tax=Pseudomonas fluorescens TaxID=294 RepID=UPI003523DF06